MNFRIKSTLLKKEGSQETLFSQYAINKLREKGQKKFF